jgi:formate/nitrite transporter
LPTQDLILLGSLGGLYNGFGGALATLVLTDNSLGIGLGRLTAGLAFSLGLVMLVLAGGELFAGNNLMVLACASRKASARALLRNWTLAYGANAAGGVLLAFAIYYSGALDSGGVSLTAIRIAETKAQLGVVPAFLRGILCNTLVCLAIWLSVAARSFEGKAIAIVFPISALVALGFEHCVANFYLLPVAMLAGANVSLLDLIRNIVPVTAGNTVGGVGAALAYWLIT